MLINKFINKMRYSAPTIALITNFVKMATCFSQSLYSKQRQLLLYFGGSPHKHFSIQFSLQCFLYVFIFFFVFRQGKVEYYEFVKNFFIVNSLSGPSWSVENSAAKTTFQKFEIKKNNSALENQVDVCLATIILSYSSLELMF